MHTHDGGGGGGYAPHFPLPHYEGQAGETSRAGDVATGQHAPLRTVQTSLESRTTVAAGHVEGLLLEPMLAAPTVPRVKAGEIGRASLLAGGVMKAFADAIETYDAEVDQLNQEYATARGRDFGVSADAGDPDMTDAERASAHADAVDAADLALRRALGAREREARQLLDDTGDTLAGTLADGPTEESLLLLTIAGHIPTDRARAELGPGVVPVSAGGTTGTDDDSWLQEYLRAEMGNLFGNGDHFPLISLIVAGGKMTRMSRGVAPIFQTGIVGRHFLNFMESRGGTMARTAQWLRQAPRHGAVPRGIPGLRPPKWVSHGGSAGWGPIGGPGGMGIMRTLGVAGGVINTGMGVHDLIQQGDPREAFRREGAGYVADVAETAFSATTTAFLVAPNPVTATLAVGTGLVWAGAEVVDHWDEISETASDAWDGASDLASDALDGASNLASDAKDTLGDGVDTVKGWFS